MPPPRISRLLGALSTSLRKIGRWDRFVAAKKELRQMLGTTKLHGCYRLYSGKTYTKVFWLVVMLSAASVFIEIAAQLFYLLHHRNVDTQVEIVYDHAEQPMVSVCSYNVVRNSYVEELKRTRGFSQDLLNYLMHIYSSMEDYWSSISPTDMKIGQQLLDEYIVMNPNFTIPSFVANASQRCADFILSCQYEGADFNCCDPRYTTPMMTDLGQCYQTNLTKLKQDFTVGYQFGASQGLQMLLDFRTDEQISVSNSSGILVKWPFFNLFENGFRIHIHDEMAISFMSTEVISVSPNNKIAIALRPTKYQFLERSVGGACRSSWPNGYFQTIPYSETLCQARCIALTYVSLCGCTPLRFNFLRDKPTCTPKELYDCVATKFPISHAAHAPQLIPDCQECSPQCQHFVYYSHNSYAHDILPSTMQYLQQFGSRFTPQYVRQNMVGMHVFFESKKFVLYSQSPLSDFTNVLSNIGGNMGLFHGASVISLFEMALLVFKAGWALISSKRTSYMKSKRMMEDARKKRLEEILNDDSLCMQNSHSCSQMTEDTTNSEVAPTSDPQSTYISSSQKDITDAEELSTSDPQSTYISSSQKDITDAEELSAENLSMKMINQPRQRNGTVSFLITPALAEALLYDDLYTGEPIQLVYNDNKLVISRAPAYSKTRSFTVI